MNNSFQFKITWMVLVLIVLVFSPNHNVMAGYLDPGSGSLIIQIVIAAILGLLVTIRVYWARIINFMSGRKTQVENNDTPNGINNDSK